MTVISCITMGETESAEDFMNAWGKTHGITPKTLQILHDQEIASKDVLLTLSKADIDTLGLTIGQRNMLKVGIAELKEPGKSSMHQAGTPLTQVTTRGLAGNDDLSAALESLKNAHLTDILAGDLQPAAVNTSKSKGKALYIPDFVTDPKSSSKPAEKELTKDVFIRAAGKSKVVLEEVTAQQWISANARIMLELIDDMDLVTIKSYLRYTVKIGNYFQNSEPATVLKLDDAHRKAVSDGTADFWNKIDSDDVFFYLTKKTDEDEAPKQLNRKYKRKYPVDGTGKSVCFDFNKPQGCHRENCIYAHVCQVAGCTEDHPKYQHSYPPRFRGRNN